MPLPEPVILVPAITASYLTDRYPLPPQDIWSEKFFLGQVVGQNKDFERASLHPDNPRLEAREPARVVPGQPYEVVYEEIIEELRHNLSDRVGLSTPVYPFSYDWRRPLEDVESQLSDFIDEVIDRTRLMGRNHREYRLCNAVNLIGHSMGGLIIAGYLANCIARGQDSKVRKVVSLASPFQGSYDSVVKLTTGTGNLGDLAPRPRERKAARLTPSLYHLVPSFENSMVVENNTSKPGTWFDPAMWQPSIIKTISEYVREFSVSPGNQQERDETARKIFSNFLETAREHRRKLDELQLDDTGMENDAWLCIIGVNALTRVALPIRWKRGIPEFQLRRRDRKNQWDSGNTALDCRVTGDETVPFEGAIPRFLDYESLVCITPNDFERGEIGDRLRTALGGFHGLLPNMNLVHRLIVRHFTGRGNRYGSTWASPPPGVDRGDWTPPILPLDPPPPR